MGATEPRKARSKKLIGTILPEATCLARGYAPITRSDDPSARPFNLYYEHHGLTKSETSKKLVFIMGMNNSCFGWTAQVEHFGAKEGYECVVFDNRGCAGSDHPGGLYTTRILADDTRQLLDFLGWTKPRQVNVIGVSLGGMISLELALAIPDRIATLILTSTQAGDKPDPPSKKAVNLFAKLLLGPLRPPKANMALVADCLFPPSFLDAPSELDPTKKRREVIEADFLWRHERTAKQSMGGKLGQISAALRHHVSPEACAQISKSIPKVGIVTGDTDHLVTPLRSKELSEYMPEAEYVVKVDAGHALCSQVYEWYNAWVEKCIDEGLAGGALKKEDTLVSEPEVKVKEETIAVPEVAPVVAAPQEVKVGA